MKIKCYGVCHFSWSWFFKKFQTKKKIILKITDYENMAHKIFFHLLPKGVYNNILDKKKLKMLIS